MPLLGLNQQLNNGNFLNASSVATNMLQDSAVTAAKIAAATILGSNIAANTISSGAFLSSDWSNSVNNPGYQKLPSGIWIMWGTCNTGSPTTTFPTAFPNTCFVALLTVQGSANNLTGTPCITVNSNSQFTVYGPAGWGMFYIAIGH